MAQQFKMVLAGNGGRVPHTPGSAVVAGDPVIINGMACFAPHAIPAGVLGTLLTAGGPPSVWGVKANGAISVGNAVYWDADGNPQGGTAGSGCLTTTSTGNTFFGRCIEAAGATDETVLFEMSIGVVTNGGLENAIADPGNAGAIPVDRTGHVAIVTAGAETRTLAAPTAPPGSKLLIYGKTLVGACVITCATDFDSDDNNTLTLAAAGDCIELVVVEEGANKRWRLGTGTLAEALLSDV